MPTPAVEPDAAAIERAMQPLPGIVPVAAIGTPVMDGRLRLQYSRQNYLMEDAGVGSFVHFDATDLYSCGFKNTSTNIGCASSTTGGCGILEGGCGASGSPSCACSIGGGAAVDRATAKVVEDVAKVVPRLVSIQRRCCHD
ncbi:hypothetical protein H310_04278 [Aphanomyces invadans]|uniref:Uncharacterized protein n=1 Tax=Aphanomyces invadans TaxID=157072 RepID=A0A024UGC6_9STRA|nr:hypothetical protein H310_04278 [Aphanomyces invadans]ETW05339.1 hypothetical protein H310_04278 [Aphanomyces invadans]|eukprot:XP_008866777.1 hypothetical protein H310_04278 [Aphanomyces invadans]